MTTAANKIFVFQSDVLSNDREVSLVELETWCNENGIASYIETSAKNASNVQEGFRMAVQHWLKLESKAEKTECTYNDTIDLTKKNSDTRSSCCLGSGEEQA